MPYTISIIYYNLCHYNNTKCAARDLKEIHRERRRDIIIILYLLHERLRRGIAGGRCFREDGT